MGLIINKKIQELMEGYPTVSDKYNVAGGMLAGTQVGKFGGLVKYSDTTGYYEAVNASNTAANVSEIAGFILATNVKLTDNWPGTTVQVNPGEAFNLLLNGYIAVKLAKSAEEHITDIKPNTPVYITANGEVTVSTDLSKLGDAALPNATFTGIVEDIGTAGNKIYLAEIVIK